MPYVVDPEASLALWDLDVDLGGRRFTVPALPASGWFPVILSADVYSVLDMLVSTGGEDPEDPMDLVLAGTVPADELGKICLQAVEEVAGRPFQVAYVLAVAAESQWQMINGRLSLAGFDWDERPIGAALDAIFMIILEGMHTEEKRKEFLALLDQAVPANPEARPEDAAKAETEFANLAGPKPTGGVRASGAPSDGARSRIRSRPLEPRQDAASGAPNPRPGVRARSGRPASS